MKETDVEKIRQTVSRTDLNGNQKVILILALFDSLTNEPDFKSILEVERLEFGYLILQDKTTRIAANDKDSMAVKTSSLIDKSIDFVDKLYHNKASKVEVSIEIRVTN
jgi:hypothetical protein